MSDSMAKAADVTVRISRQETLLIMYDHGKKDLAHTTANSPCIACLQGTVGVWGEWGADWATELASKRNAAALTHGPVREVAVSLHLCVYKYS